LRIYAKNVDSINLKAGALQRFMKKRKEDDAEDIELVGLTAEEEYNYKQAFARSKNDYPTLLRVFRMLQLMCKSNARNIFKGYCRIQYDNYETFDLVKELVQFLKVFEGLIGSEGNNFGLAFQFFSCMNELISNEIDNQVS
jgi:hypothetical protein